MGQVKISYGVVGLVKGVQKSGVGVLFFNVGGGGAKVHFSILQGGLQCMFELRYFRG